MSTATVNGRSGRITYTQWLDHEGMLAADLTVAKLADDDFLVVATDTAHRRVHTLLRDAIGDAHAFVTDVTGAYAQINVQGPRSRALLQSLTAADLSHSAFPFRTAREIDLGYARALCVRITYVGELGYELYVPAEQAVHVYDRIVAVGEPLGLRHAGLKALSSLRMEKGYRDYGHDIDNTDDPREAGFSHKATDFVGRVALLARTVDRQLVQVQLLDPEPLLFHAEVLLRDDEPVGYVRSASYGHTLGGAVGLAMIRGPLDGTWEAEVNGTRYPARVSATPMYDPTNARIRL
jgi:heterotetrameric sarcosine oxidase gamma subunit